MTKTELMQKVRAAIDRRAEEIFGVGEVLADPARIELVLKGGALCADRRAGRG